MSALRGYDQVLSFILSATSVACVQWNSSGAFIRVRKAAAVNRKAAVMRPRPSSRFRAISICKQMEQSSPVQLWSCIEGWIHLADRVGKDAVELRKEESI